VILGKRGVNVTGVPVYAGAFQRGVHVRDVLYDSTSVLLEGWDYGKHHPCVVWAQQPYSGGLWLLGGILGQDMFLDDFVPLVQQYRAQWFSPIAGLQACCDPAGTHDNSHGSRFTGLSILQSHGIYPAWRENSNAPDVRAATIEAIAGHMRRRGLQGESFGVAADPARWLRVSHDGVEPMPFVAVALEAGYVWDAHMVSVGSKQVRKPHKDGWFEHGMNTTEYLELNFGAEQPTREADEQAKARAKAASQPQVTSWMG
jgi:hypothetical protein